MTTDIGIAEALNRDCHCIRVDRERLARELKAGLPEGGRLSLDLEGLHQRLFADSPVFVAKHHIDVIQETVAAIYRVAETTVWWRAVLPTLPDSVDRAGRALLTSDPGFPSGAAGALVSVDFHLSEDGPRLIEINTNAGGALLALHQARAQKACCEPVARASIGQSDLGRLEADLVAMFRSEYAMEQRRSQADGKQETPVLRSVAIVDVAPAKQFLHPEMQLFVSLMAQHGIKAVVVDPALLVRESGRLWVRDAEGKKLPVDLVYNRLTDFYLEAPDSKVLRDAWLAGEVGLSPNPWNYARLADKRRLPLLLEPRFIEAAGLDPGQRKVLQDVIPPSVVASPELAEELWADRKNLFFKPVSGYGSRGAFSGKKITRKVFQQAIATGALAQRRIVPSERTLMVDGALRQLKVDLRAIVYDGTVQFLMARLYRGQTTNLRTEGGGLATVFAVGDGILSGS